MDGLKNQLNILASTSLYEHIPELPKSEAPMPLFLYRLGEPIKTKREIRNGRIFPSGRLWCELDILLTSDTVYEAWKKSKLIIERYSSLT